MSAEKAFELGEALRDDLGWETSGAEFLWACGYWPEVLELVKHLAVSEEHGVERAVFLYCWLPLRMHAFEIKVLNRRFADKLETENLDLNMEISKGRMFALLHPVKETDLAFRIQSEMLTDRGAREAERYLFDQTIARFELSDDPFLELIDGLDLLLRSRL